MFSVSPYMIYLVLRVASYCTGIFQLDSGVMVDLYGEGYGSFGICMRRFGNTLLMCAIPPIPSAADQAAYDSHVN